PATCRRTHLAQVRDADCGGPRLPARGPRQSLWRVCERRQGGAEGAARWRRGLVRYRGLLRDYFPSGIDDGKAPRKRSRKPADPHRLIVRHYGNLGADWIEQAESAAGGDIAPALGTTAGS